MWRMLHDIVESQRQNWYQLSYLKKKIKSNTIGPHERRQIKHKLLLWRNEWVVIFHCGTQTLLRSYCCATGLWLPYFKVNKLPHCIVLNFSLEKGTTNQHKKHWPFRCLLWIAKRILEYVAYPTISTWRHCKAASCLTRSMREIK